MNEAKVRRQHAHHRVALVIERDWSSNDISIGAEAALPQTMTDDRGALAARAIFSRKKVTAESGLHAEQCKEISGDAIAVQSFRLARAGQCQVIGVVGRDLGERLTLF